jgi:tetratricopeptide (TPR) repeat protein
MGSLERWNVRGASEANQGARWLTRLDRYAPPGTQSRVEADNQLASFHRAGQRWAEARRFERRALESARELGDMEMVVRVATRIMLQAWAPIDWPEWVALAEELAHIPRTGTSDYTRQRFLFFAGDMLLTAGYRSRMEELFHEREILAARSNEVDLRFAVPAHSAYRRMLDGDLEGTLAGAQHMIELGEELGVPVRGRSPAINLSFWPLLWLGRSDELAKLDTARLQPGGSLSFGRAELCLAHEGRLEEAKSRLKHSLDHFDVSEQASARHMAYMLEAAVLAQDREAAARLAPALLDVPAITTFLSAVTRHQGGAARLLGDRATALERYERALEWAGKVHFRPEVALTRLELAELLLDDGMAHTVSREERKQERARAHEHLDFAIGELRAMKMQPAVERALRLQALAGV